MMQRQHIVYLGLLSAAFGWSGALWADDKEPREPVVSGVKAENDQLRKEVAALESRVRALQAELEQARVAASQAQMQADAFESRCRKLQEEASRSRATGTLTARPEAGPPRAEFAVRGKPASEAGRGRITAVGKSGSLLQISLGADDGIKEGQTLQVFRPGSDAAARPLYLGTMTLIRVEAQAALGEFAATPAVMTRPKVGDEALLERSVK
jgi:hypothetical protein